MADRVLVEVIVNLTDMRRGDQAWVVETDRVLGMVAGGYWKIVSRETVKDVKPRKAVNDGPDPDQPE